MKKLLYAAPLALALALAGCGETTVEDVTDKDKTEAKADDKEKAETKEEKVEDKVYAVGDTVKVNGVEITVTKASYTPPAEYSESANGKILTLEINVKNSSDGQAFVDNTDFGLSVGDQQADDYYSYDEMAFSQDLNKGKQANGKLYYDVAEADSYELIYTPSFSFDSKEVKWDIKVK